MTTLTALEATKKARWCLAQIEKASQAGKIIQFLYQINLDEDGKLKPGSHKEVAMLSVVKGAHGLLADIEELEAKMLVISLGLEWTGVSTTVTVLCDEGITNRRADGRSRYISLQWDIIKQIHHAMTTGRVVPATEIKL